MLGFCRDPLVDQLHKLGYSLVPLAEASIQPLELVGRQGKGLFRFGKLDELFEASREGPLPAIHYNIKAADLQVTRTSSLDAGFSLTLMLNKWLGGDKLGLKEKLRRSDRFEFQLGEVKKDLVALGLLDAFLVGARLSLNMPTVERLLDQDEVYVTTSVLKARTLMLQAKSERMMETNIDVPTLGEVVAGSVAVKVDSQDGSKLLFEASTPLVFAFQAVQIRCDHGYYKAIRIDCSNLRLMSEDGLATADAAAETGYLCDRVGPGFVRFSVDGAV